MDYLSYFNLNAEPFSHAPNPRFYYASSQHTKALERLMHVAATGKGLALLTGDIGHGKTTLARRMLDALPDTQFEAALLIIVHTNITANWLLKRIAMQLGVDKPAEDKLTILSQLYTRLVQINEQKKRAIVLIDEAQMLQTRELMEEFRGLLNLEVPGQKLISFVFFGLPEMERNLALDPPLLQRVALRYRLQPLSLEDTMSYVSHRLKLAGGAEVFDPQSLEEVHRWAKGVPRVINTLCDNVLLELFMGKARRASPEMVAGVAETLGLLVQITPPEIPARPPDAPAIEGGPGHDAIVAVSREGGELSPDAIAARVAGEEIPADATPPPSPKPAAAVAVAAPAVVPAAPPRPAPILPTPQPPAPLSTPAASTRAPVASPPAPTTSAAARVASPPASTASAAARVASPPAPTAPAAARVTAPSAPAAIAQSALPGVVPSMVIEEDRGPPVAPVRMASSDTVDIEDPLAFLGPAVEREPDASGGSFAAAAAQEGFDIDFDDEPHRAAAAAAQPSAAPSSLSGAFGKTEEVKTDEFPLPPPELLQKATPPPKAAAPAPAAPPPARKQINLQEIDDLLAEVSRLK